MRGERDASVTSGKQGYALSSVSWIVVRAPRGCRQAESRGGATEHAAPAQLLRRRRKRRDADHDRENRRHCSLSALSGRLRPDLHSELLRAWTLAGKACYQASAPRTTPHTPTPRHVTDTARHLLCGLLHLQHTLERWGTGGAPACHISVAVLSARTRATITPPMLIGAATTVAPGMRV